MIAESEIRALIPHAGKMCLLQQVTSWNDDEITCRTTTHRALNNPLRREGKLSIINAFEYGAQAAAIHGGLRARAAGGTAPPCYLAALRDAQALVRRLDDIEEPLEVSARRIFGDAGNTVYECLVAAQGKPLAKGRVTIIQRK